MNKFIENINDNNILSENTLMGIFSKVGYRDDPLSLVSIHETELSTIHDRMKDINISSEGFGKTNSQFEKSFFTLTHQTPYRNLKQILAEINKIRGNLKGTDTKLRKDVIRLAKLKEKIKNCSDKYKKALLQIELEDKQSNLADSRLFVEGAIKELYHLQQLFEEIKANHGIKDLDEIDVEEAEEEYHIKRGFEQAYQNMNDNSVSMGLAEQEYLLQNGINPVQAKLDIVARINEVQQEAQYRLNQNDNSRITMDGHYKWLDDMVEKYKGCSKDVMKRKGIDSTFSPEICFKNDDKLKLENKGI